ncbi:PRC protein [Aurantimonas sp. 22II-16-19i]|nr:PRC protein [Aurantimonas sp. 22II-16-19i]
MKTNLKAALLMSSILVAPAAFAQDNTRNANDPALAQDQQTGGADVVVDPDAPEIRVNVPEPDVSVDQASPDVNVTQPRATVIVRQPAPNVTVDIPQPEITVRMPEPQVDVSQSQPDVNVSQGQPQVNIGDQDRADVETNDDETQANVTVQQSRPQVSIQDSDQRPEIRYEREEANVTVNQPEGEPRIRYEDAEGNEMSADGSNMNAQDRMAQSDDDTVQTSSTSEQAGTQGNDANLYIAVAVDAAREVQMTVDEIAEYNIMGANGDVLGDIENVANINGDLYAVIGAGGFLGMGEKQVAIPLKSLMVQDGGFVAPSISENQIEGMQEFNTGQYPMLDGDRAITLGSV